MRGHAMNTPAQVFRAHCSICGVTRYIHWSSDEREDATPYRLCSVCDGPAVRQGRAA